jgi:PKD repeat protein
LTYAYTNTNSCTNTEDLVVDIIFGDTVLAGTNESVCIDELSFNLTGFSPAGGIWTGIGIIDGSAGIFDPATAGVGTHTLFYTYGIGTCQKIVTKTVIVNSLPIVNAGNNQTICVNVPQYTLGGQSPSGGVWIGIGIIDSTAGVFDPATAGVGTFTITYTYANPSTGCDAFDTKVIIINALPIINMPDTVEYCNSGNDITLSGYSPTGGTWSGIGIIDAANGVFNATQAGGIGNYTLTYTYTNANSCTNTEDLIVAISFGDTVVAGVQDTVCVDESQFALTGYSPLGGIWSGTGIIDAANGIFDPATAGVGTYTLSYTYGTGTCQKTATKIIIVGAVPVVNAGNNQTVCLNDPAFNLAGYSPLGGIWTGIGVSNTGTFDPTTAGIGVHTLTYTYINPFTNCDAFDTKTIAVNGLPIVTVPNNLVYCDNPNSITLTGYSPAGGLWSGAGIIDGTNGIFNSTQAGGIGTYTLLYTYTNANGCSNTGNVVVDVIYGDTVVAGPSISLCLDAGLTTLTGFSPAGGTWSGTGIVDATNGIFDPVASGVGTHIITYSYGSGTCLKTVSNTVVVHPLPIVSAGNDVATCINSSEFVLSGQSPTGGIWTGIGVTNGMVGTFNPAIAGVGTHILTYTYTNPTTGCLASDTKLVTINPLPIVTVQDTVYYCFTPNNITLSGYSPLGGTWSGTGIVDGNNGVFNGNSAGGVGTYQVVYSYSDVNSCTNKDTMIIVVDPSIPVFAGNDISLCIDNGNYQLTGFSPAGGTWLGAGIVNTNTGVFDPQLAGGGLHVLTYTYGLGSCLNSDNITVFVGTIPTVNAGTDRIVCFTDNAFSLNGFSPPNGIWVGNGITNPIGVFDPATAGVGIHTLTYTFINTATGCEDFDTKLVTVLPPPAVNAGDTVVYCNTNQNVTLTNYTPLGGIWTGSGVVDNANGIFNPNVAGGEGAYHLAYALTDANGCSNLDSLVVIVIYGDTVYAGLPDTVCIDDAQFTLMDFTPVSGGLWSGTGIVDANVGVFDPATAGIGNHTITYTYGIGTCEKTSTKTVFVGALPTINLGLNDTVCINSAAFNIGGYSPQGGIWSGIGIANGNAGTFDPSIAGVGTHIISYTFVNNVTGCDRTRTKNIVVRPLPTVFVTDIIYCDNPNDITLTGYSPAGGTWSGSGIVSTNGVFNSSVAGGIGIYTLTYTYADNFGCESLANMIVDVIFGDTVQAGPNVNICIDDAPITLTGQLPASGGIWTGNGIIDQALGIFDPATAGVGNHILTWTYGTGTCLKTSTRTVTVSNPPNVSAGLDELYCINNPSFTLGSYSPIGGVWSGTGITDSIAGIFDPSVSGVGSFTLTYYYYNTVTNCDAFDTKLMVIAPLPIVATGDSAIYCNNPNNITLSGYSPQGGTWSGPGVLDGLAGIFNTVQAGGLGTYILTYTYSSANGCTSSDDLIVSVVFGDTVQAGSNLAVCIDDGLVTLTGQLPASGGTWTGNGIIDPIVGIFDPVTAGTGTHILTWTYGTGTCAKTSTRTIRVSNPPTVSAGIDKVYCIDDAPITFNGYSPTGGVWSGTGITDSIVGIFDPSVSGVGTHTLTYYYYNASTNCDAFDTKIATVAPLPIVATGDSITYCANPNNITLTGYSPAGGTWSGPGIIDPAAGIFTTAQAGGIGTYTLLYTYTDGNGCENSKDLIVEVIFGDTVQAGPSMAVCIDDGVVNLAGQLPASGGTWSGNGIIDPIVGIFDPVTAGTGTHILTWTYGTGTCEKTSTRTIAVSNPPNVNAGVNRVYCINDAPITFNGYSPTGGTWSGVGITDSIVGIFDPSVSGVGTYTLTYYYYNASTNCDAFDTKIVTVAPLPIVVTGDSVTYCANPNNVTLTGYSPAGGTWSGPGIIDPAAGIFTTAQAGGIGTYTLLYTYTDGNGCENSKDLIVEVIFGDTVQAGPSMAVCIDDGVVNLTGQLPASGGTWTGNGIIDPILGIFDPVAAGTGTHILTWTYGTGTCEKTSTRTIAVSNPPNVNAGINRVYCINNAPIIFNGYSPTGGVWSGVGITDSVVGIFDPSVSGIGTYTLTYYYYNASTNCDAFDTRIVTVAPLPIVATGDSVTYCANPNNITLTGYSPAGGTWSGPGIIDPANGIFTTIQAGGIGTYPLSYTYTDGNGCTNSKDLIVEVIFGDTVQAGPSMAVCIDDGAVNLTGQLPASGGTWTGNGIIDPILGIFDPVAAGTGTHILTWTYGIGTCEKTSTRTIAVSNPPNVNAGANQSLCINNAPIIFNSYSPTGGVWSGVGITDSLAGVFDPSVSGVGTYTLTYYYNTSTNCDAFDTKTITVSPLPTVSAMASVTYCDNPNNITLTGYSPQGGVWTGAGIINSTGIFSTAQAGGLGYSNSDTMYVLTYIFTDANGCENTADMTVNIIFGDTVVAGPSFAICEDAGSITLADQTPLGGTWSGTGISDPITGVFDPSLSGIGTFILDYTYGSGTCQKISTRTVTVGAVPTVNAGVDLNRCENVGTLLLGGQTPLGGAWSGIGITDTAAGIFDPIVSGLGTFTITYTFTNNVTGCEGIDTRIIKINPIPTVTTEDSVFYCLTSNNIQLTGFTPTTGGQWSGPGIVNPNTGVFNSGQAGGIGTYLLDYTYTDGNGCTNSESLLVDISFGDTVVAGSNIAVCITDAAFTLIGNTPITGGTWSGNGIIDPVLGVFDPSSAGQGTHILTWTYGIGTCEKTSTRTVVVGSPPSVVAGVDQFLCIDGGQILLGGNSPVGGTWFGMGIVDSVVGMFDPITAGLGQHTISYYVVNTVTGCENTDYKTITVGDIPPVAVTDSVIFCANPNNIILTDYVSVTPPNGIWSGPGVVDPVNGIFSTTIAGGLGSYNLIYTFSASNSCENRDTLNISVIYGDTVVAGPNDTLCLGENPIIFTGFSPAGGTWSGPGIINSNAGEFDPNFAGVGLHTVTYTYGSGTCEKKITKKVLVDAPPTINIGSDQTVCIDATPFILGGYSPQGGIWSGVGITNPITGLFNPVSAGVGTHTLTYVFVNSISGCSNSDARDITVVPLPIVYAGDTLEFCNSNTNIILSTYVNYSPLGGQWSGSGVVDPVNGIFNTISAGGLGNYNITYSLTDGNGCFNSDQLNIGVIFGDTVVAGPNVALCIDAGLYQLTGFSPFGGLWSSANANTNNAIIDAVNGIFDVQAAGAGPHTLIYTYGSGTCEKRATRVIFVGTPPVVNPGANQTICISVPTFTLTGFSPQGGTWAGNGIVNSTSIFSPTLAGIGTHTLTYTVTNLVTGCETVQTKTITINPLPIVFAGDTLEICANPNSFTLTGYSPFGGVWSGLGIIDATGGVFSSGVAGGIGVHPVIYQFTDNNGCSNKDTLVVDVIYGDTVLAGLNDSVCVDATPFLLGGSPLGGVWSGNGVNGATGIFNPFIAGVGSHVVTYTYGAGTCEKTDNKIIYVGTPITIDAGVNQVACVDATQLFLSGASISGGIWSGAGVVNGVTGEFNPQLVGVGFHTILYTYTDPVTDCESMDTKIVEVKPLPVVDAGGTVTYCDWPLDIPLTNYSPGGNGGVWSGAGIVNPTLGIFNTGLAGGIGTYTLTYTFSDNFGCVNAADLIVDVIYGDTVKAGPDITVCIDGGNVQLTGNSPLGGIFTGVGVDSFGIFNPLITGGGVHEVYYTQGFETCVKSDTVEITVIDLTGTTAGPDENTCLESGPVLLSGNLPLGGVWSGSGIVDATTGLFEPLAANNDTVFISYTYIDVLSGCSYTDTKMVTINPLPNIDFVMSADTVCLNGIVTFTNTSDANAGNFQWFFGDGTSSIFFQPTHTYSVAGTYQVMLLGISPSGCPDTTIQTIEVYQLATPSFTVNTDDGCGPLQVNFANTSVGQEMTFAWDFGNGQTSTLVNPGMRTFQPGTFDTTYVITLDVINRCGVMTFTDTITVRPIPVVIMGADNNSGCTPLPVNFTNFSTGNATSYVWNFGNGTTSTDSIPPTQFFITVDTITVYTVTLTASNACGSDSESVDITVEPGSINAFFSADTTIGCQPLTINFTSLATPNSTVTWDFGDGNTLAGPAATAGVIAHVFDTAGVFTVTQYVSNYCGLDTFSVNITVHPSIDVSFAQAAPFACEDATFQFTNTSLQPLAGIAWDFGDGATSNALNPQHVYTTPGTYTVIMTGYSTSFGCPADTQSVIQVFAKPNATFATNANSGCTPVNVNFTNTSSSSAIFFAWDFGDGNSSNLPNPSHAFINTGNYVVTLTATDANGCADDTTMVNFIVFPSPISSFVPDATSQCGLNDYVELTNTSQGATQYYWNFGNGQYSNLTNPTINYNQLGDYTITLVTQNQFNCNDTIQTIYSVLPGPAADFEIESQNGCEPLTVQFSQASTNSTNFYWYFGDGDSANVANPIHTYNDGGTYNVTMVASLNDICFDTFYIPGAVFVDVAPEASFIMEEFNPSNPTGTYNFTNTSIGASIYFWDFGDGNTSTDENPQHRYDYNGLKQVMLVAVSPTGCVDTTLFELAPTFFGGLYVPNAFSPRVGIADVRVFRPVGVGLEEYRVQVFSQWGELLWESDVLDDAGVPVESWDGTYNGELMPQGAYVWKVYAIFEDGSNWQGMPDFNGTVRKIGSVTLLD